MTVFGCGEARIVVNDGWLELVVRNLRYLHRIKGLGVIVGLDGIASQ